MTRARELANFADNTAGLETLTVSDITDLTATATELNHSSGVGSALQTQIDAKLASSSYTASDVLTKIKTVDGGSSGLDADLLDGVEASSFLRSDAADTATGTITFSGTSSAPFRLEATNATSSWDAVTFQATTEWGDSTSFGVLGGDGTEGVFVRRPHVVWNSNHASADIRLGRSGGTSSGSWVNMGVKANDVGFIGINNNNVLTWGSSDVDITNGLTVAGNTAWHAGNDGSGSGLDADTLDGQHGSYYAPIASPTFTGTTNVSSGVTLPAGHVVQTVSALSTNGGSGTNGVAITSTGWNYFRKADGSTPHQLQISNVGSSNSVLVTMHFNVAWYGNSTGQNIGGGVAIYYWNGSSFVALTDVSGTGAYHYLKQDGGGTTEYRAWYGFGSIQAYHNPPISNPTYRIYGRTRHSGNNIRIGGTGVHITLMEIQA